MSYQILDNYDGSLLHSLDNPSQELHWKSLKPRNLNLGGDRISWMQSGISRHLPWCGLMRTNSRRGEPQPEDNNTDILPMQYELHSNTKIHQIGGIYESHSALKQYSEKLPK